MKNICQWAGEKAVRKARVSGLILSWHRQNIAVAFWGKLRVASVAKSSISEGLPNAQFPLLSKKHVVFPESLSPMRPVSHQECELQIKSF